MSHETRPAFVLALVAALTLGAASAPTRAHAAEPSPPSSLDVHRAPRPDEGLTYHQAEHFPTFTWALLQLLPSPELAFGTHRRTDATGNVDTAPTTAFGLRWQLAPVLWSWGVHRKQSRWRYFVVDPFARQSGSIELSTAIEYIGGHVDTLFVRPGLRAYFPVLDKGENLSVSLGTSIYGMDGLRVAYDVGAYVLSGFVGLQITVAPTHAPLAAIATLRLRYF